MAGQLRAREACEYGSSGGWVVFWGSARSEDEDAMRVGHTRLGLHYWATVASGMLPPVPQLVTKP